MYGKITTVWFSSYFLLFWLYQTWNLFLSPHSLKKVVLEMWILCSLVNLKMIYTVGISIKLALQENYTVVLICNAMRVTAPVWKSAAVLHWRHGTHLKYFQTSFHSKIKYQKSNDFLKALQSQRQLGTGLSVKLLQCWILKLSVSC